MSNPTQFYDDGHGPIPNIWYPKQPGKWTPSRDFSFFDGLSSIPPEVRDRIFYYLVFTWDETKQYPQTKPEAGEISFARLHTFTRREFWTAVKKNQFLRFPILPEKDEDDRRYNLIQARFESRNGKLDYFKSSELRSIWEFTECLDIIENCSGQRAVAIKEDLRKAFWGNIVFEFCFFNTKKETDSIIEEPDRWDVYRWEEKWIKPHQHWYEAHKEHFRYIQHLSLYYQEKVTCDEDESNYRFCNICRQLRALPNLKSLKVWARMGRFTWEIGQGGGTGWARMIRKLPVLESFKFYFFPDTGCEPGGLGFMAQGEIDFQYEYVWGRKHWEHFMTPDSLANIKDGEYQGDWYLEQLFSEEKTENGSESHE